jgi:hypothetical protein
MNILQEIDQNFVWDEIIKVLPGRRKTSGKNYININCPMCVLLGESRPDSKLRCGIVQNYDGLGVNCFNCHFKTRYVVGQPLGFKLRQFMAELGVDSLTIKRLNHKAFQLKEVAGIAPPPPPRLRPICKVKRLPAEAKSFEQWAERGTTDPDFIDVARYVASRGDAVWNATTFYWSPQRENDLHRRVIVPFLLDGEIVGWTARAIDPAVKKRYHTRSSPNFLFNNQFITGNRECILLVEGIFDALAIEGIASCGAHINDEQARWLNSTGKTVIVLPDRDGAGTALVDAALKYGWYVSFPRVRGAKLGFWRSNVKDAADAVNAYGRLYTLRTILAATIADKLKIRQLRGTLVE